MIRVRGGEPVRLIRGIDLEPSPNEGISSGFVPRKVLGCIHICIGSPFSKSRGICVSGKNMPTTASGLAPASSMDPWLRSRRPTRCSKQSTAHGCMESNCRRCKQLTAPAGHIFGFAPSPGSSLCKTESRTVGGSYRGNRKGSILHARSSLIPAMDMTEGRRTGRFLQAPCSRQKRNTRGRWKCGCRLTSVVDHFSRLNLPFSLATPLFDLSNLLHDICLGFYIYTFGRSSLHTNS